MGAQLLKLKILNHRTLKLDGKFNLHTFVSGSVNQIVI